ncbi:MAG: HD domain-containing phosphohydrolase [Chloroflexota bacterium]
MADSRIIVEMGTPDPASLSLRFSAAPVMLCALDAQGRLAAANDRWLAALDYPYQEVIGQPLVGFLVGESRSKMQAFLPELLAGEPISDVLCQVRHRQGHTLDMLCSFSGAQAADEDSGHTLVVMVNVTERMRAEDQVQQRLEQLLTIRQIDQAILTSQNLQNTLSILLDKLMAVLQVDAAAVLLLNPYSQTLEYNADLGFHSTSFRQVRLRLGEDFAGQVALQRKLIHIADLKASRGLGRPRWAIVEGFVSYCGLPLISENQIMGVLEVYHRQAFTPQEEWLDFLETLAGQAAIAVHNAALLEGLQTANVELIQAYNATIEGWSRAMELRDLETAGHSKRVTEMTMNVARALGVSVKDLEHIRRGALLHDIGKMGIPDGILLKPGKLSDEEWLVMRKHPEYAYRLLSVVPFLRPALDIPYYHHERWDGSGYPLGLKGTEIPLAARIFAVVDVWESLCHDRPYHRAWDEQEILAYLRKYAGSYFDPQVVETFVRVRQEELGAGRQVEDGDE